MNVADVSLQQLKAIKESIENELQLFSTSHSSLSDAAETFRGCLGGIQEVKNSKTKSMLIPVSSSIYVPAINDSQKTSVIIDIGTGYYIETEDIEYATDYYKRKVKMLEEQVETLAKTILEKRGTLSIIASELTNRFTQQQQQQQAHQKDNEDS